MDKNLCKSVAALFATSVLVVSSCTYSKQVSYSDPFRGAKAKRVQPSEAEAAGGDALSGPRGLKPALRLHQDGPLAEKEIPEITECQADLAAHPKDNTRRLKLAMLYHRHGLYDQASTEYHKVLDRDPKNAQAFERLGRLWLDWGASDRAIGALEQALAQRPDFVEAYNTLGLVYAARGDHARSQKAYQNALVINPALDYVHNNLCYSYSRSQAYRQAVTSCREAIRLNPQNEAAYNNLGYALGMLEDFAGAYAAFLAGGDAATAHNNLGVVLQKTQRYTEAQAHFKKAWELKPDYRTAAENYAALVARLPATDAPSKETPGATPARASTLSSLAPSNPPPAAPSPAEPLTRARRAEETVLQALAEKLRLRVLSKQPESFSFDPPSHALAPPRPPAAAHLMPIPLMPILPPEALELRPIASSSGDSLRPGPLSPGPEKAGVQGVYERATFNIDWAPSLAPVPERAAHLAPTKRSSILSPQALKLNPVESMAARAVPRNGEVLGADKTPMARPPQLVTGRADFARVAAPVPKAAARPAPAPIAPVLPPQALELHPVESSISHTPHRGDRALEAERMPIQKTTARWAPTKLTPVLPPEALELRPVESLSSPTLRRGGREWETEGTPIQKAPARMAPTKMTPTLSPQALELNSVVSSPAQAPRHDPGERGDVGPSALLPPSDLLPLESRGLNDLTRFLAFSLPSAAHGAASSSDPSLARPSAETLRPVLPMPSPVAPSRAEAENFAAIEDRRVPEFPALLLIQKVDRSSRDSNPGTPTAERTEGAGLDSANELYHFHFTVGTYPAASQTREHVVAQYNMSGPLDLVGTNGSGAGGAWLWSRSDARRAPARLAARATAGEKTVASVSSPARDGAALLLDSSPRIDPLTPPASRSAARAPDAQTPTPPPHLAGHARTGLGWEGVGALLLVLLGGSLYGLIARRALRQRIMSARDRLIRRY